MRMAIIISDTFLVVPISSLVIFSLVVNLIKLISLKIFNCYIKFNEILKLMN